MMQLGMALRLECDHWVQHQTYSNIWRCRCDERAVSLVSQFTRSSEDAEGPRDAPQIRKIAYFPKFKQITLPRPRHLGDTMSAQG